MQWRYKPRWIAQQLIDAVDFSPVVVLTGARQTGKSTLLRHEKPFADWPYLTLDDLDILEMAQTAPKELVNLHERMVIDEVQKAPHLLSAIKMQVDNDRNRRYALTGSANLLLMKGVSESLAGRALYFELYPFTAGEMDFKGPPDWITRVPFVPPKTPDSEAKPISTAALRRGFLPPVTFLRPDQASVWWNGYIRTYLERDLRDLSQVFSLPDFRKVMTLLASRSGQILVQADIARSVGISQSTAGRYINLLEIGGLFIRLQPYSRNISKRVVKSPKIFCLDTGLMCSLLGITADQGMEGAMFGQLFETFVFQNLYSAASVSGARLFYLRKQGGLEREIDFLLETSDGILCIEVKGASRVGPKDAGNMAQLREMLPRWKGGVVIYDGVSVKPLREGIWAVPWSLL